jgi:hypothetical protein
MRALWKERGLILELFSFFGSSHFSDLLILDLLILDLLILDLLTLDLLILDLFILDLLIFWIFSFLDLLILDLLILNLCMEQGVHTGGDERSHSKKRHHKVSKPSLSMMGVDPMMGVDHIKSDSGLEVVLKRKFLNSKNRLASKNSRILLS